MRRRLLTTSVGHMLRRAPAMWLGILMVVAIAGCASGAGADRPSDSEGSPAVSSSGLLDALPDEVFGHTLTKVIVPSEDRGGARWIQGLLVELGREPADLTVALAYDPEFPELHILAVRVRGVAADRLAGAYLAVTIRAVPDLDAQDRDFGGKHAVCFAFSPASPMDTCVGARDDVLFVVTSSEFVHITEAIKAIL